MKKHRRGEVKQLAQVVPASTWQANILTRAALLQVALCHAPLLKGPKT